MRPEQATHAFISAFIDGLVRAGVRHVCACPGSRSTPLTLLLGRHPSIKLWMHLDERSAAFFALGIAKVRHEPVAVVGTSGTAVANFLPAVVEARYARVPLIVLSADRPPELREVGAPQTIDQIHLYGSHVKWFSEVGLPEADDRALRYACMLGARAAETAASPPAGPVHLNFPLREPLVPVPPEASSSFDRRPTRVVDGVRALDRGQIEALSQELVGAERGLIVCGPQDEPELAPAVAELARTRGYPILADPLSQVRCGQHDRSLVLDSYGTFLRGSAGRAGLRLRGGAAFLPAPEVVLRFGGTPTSKTLLQWLQGQDCRQLVIDGGAGWNDPIQAATDMIRADPVQFCADLTLSWRGAAAETDWLRTWLDINRRTRRAIGACLADIDEPFEGKVFAELADVLSDGAILYVGNSMPVRDLDSFYPSTDRAVHFLANRGTNGIDGVVSSALGVSAVSEVPLVLVIGDLSFYHDMTGLLAAKLHALDATIVLLNNDGGGIFSFLPQATQVPEFEPLFGTPHGLDFSQVVGMYGGQFERISTWPAFRHAVQRGLGTSGLTVVEVPTERARNVLLHEAIAGAVASRLEQDVAEVHA